MQFAAGRAAALAGAEAAGGAAFACDFALLLRRLTARLQQDGVLQPLHVGCSPSEAATVAAEGLSSAEGRESGSVEACVETDEHKKDGSSSLHGDALPSVCRVDAKALHAALKQQQLELERKFRRHYDERWRLRGSSAGGRAALEAALREKLVNGQSARVVGIEARAFPPIIAATSGRVGVCLSFDPCGIAATPPFLRVAKCAVSAVVVTAIGSAVRLCIQSGCVDAQADETL
ncbi:hypothetical protein cyc_00726 [Cyclospora cayetanensis]|uniref:Uncharacterized protein n=1 Tax=Cyclospora cayetanensis TaxID=88456 RepID=A0A1D3CUA9_9EIME|nr:hypothetical protein cyc_00726 [Cyclospora cayetanensis]